METLMSPKWQELYERSFPVVDPNLELSTASVNVGKKMDIKLLWLGGICFIVIIGFAVYKSNQKKKLYNSRSP